MAFGASGDSISFFSASAGVHASINASAKRDLRISFSVKHRSFVWLDAILTPLRAARQGGGGFSDRGEAERKLKPEGVGKLFYKAKAALVAWVQARQREVDKDVGGGELPVDHRAVADAAAGAHIAFQHGRQAADAFALVDRRF